MEMFHWDYITLMQQPSYILQNIEMYLYTQKEYESKNAKPE